MAGAVHDKYDGNMTVPDPIDIHVGNRGRLRRLWVGLSQAKLGDCIGLSFQQIQKYEAGANRIGASRLFDLSQALDVPVEYFFEEISSSDTPANSVMAEMESSGLLYEAVSTRDTLNLNRALIKIEYRHVRRSVIDLIHALGD